MNEIDEYLNNVKPEYKGELERIRSIVKKMVPEAEEDISYGMPTFRYKKKNLIHFAAFKDHMSIFPTSGPTEVLKDKLSDFKLSKGTIQFTAEKNVPEEIIKEIVALRLESIG